MTQEHKASTATRKPKFIPKCWLDEFVLPAASLTVKAAVLRDNKGGRVQVRKAVECNEGDAETAGNNREAVGGVDIEVVSCTGAAVDTDDKRTRAGT